MANVYSEVTIDAPTPAQVNSIFETEFGFVLNGNYYFSPIDPKFGIMADTSTEEFKILNLTLDGGITNSEMCGASTSNVAISSFSYQLSENKSVIYMSVKCTVSGRQYAIDQIIAYDENDKAIHIHSEIRTTGSVSYYKVIHHTGRSDNQIIFDECLYVKTNGDAQNVVYKYPSLMTNCMFKELYAVVNLQSYPSSSGTYVNFAGKVFRIIECASTCTSLSDLKHRPYFAFPVGDA